MHDEIEFHRHAHGAGVEDHFFLARDGSSGHLFIRQQWASDPTEDAKGGDGNLSIGDFLRGNGERQAALMALIGSLIPNRGKAGGAGNAQSNGDAPSR